MALAIDTLSFEIANATVSGILADPHWCDAFNGGRGKGLIWHIAVDTVARTVEGEEWTPLLERGGIEHPLKSWRDLETLRLSWQSPYDPRTGEPNGNFYVFEHEDISSAEIRLGRRSGDRFPITWTGRCAINWGGYGDGVSFRLETELVFDGIRVDGSQRDADGALIERLRHHISVDDLLPQRLERKSARYGDGVCMCEQLFLPRLS